MKKLIIILVAAAMAGCGIYKPYTRPEEVNTDGLYGDIETADTMTLGNIRWQEMFTDPYLQGLIETALENNTDLQSAYWRVMEAEATLKSARLAYLPSFNFAPNGGVSSFDNAKATWTYSVPVNASWEIDIFGRMTNNKRRAKALYAQSEEYRQAVQTQLIASVANLYYTLLMLDAQYNISLETAEKWEESVNTMRAMMDAGMTNAAGVAQTEASYYSIEASLYDLRYQIRETENTLAALLGEAPHSFERGRLENQVLPEELIVGVPLQMLSNRPDVKSAEYSLVQAYYTTAAARSALYPSLSLSGLVGWTNNGGAIIENPGKLLLQAAASLTQPIFNAGQNRAQLKIAKAQQQEALLSFQQTLLNAGGEVNNALAKAQAARAKADYQAMQVASLETAVESTQLLMRHGSTTYLEVLTAQQSLLSAQLTQVSNRFDEIQAIVNLYQALGGGRDLDTEESETDAK